MRMSRVPRVVAGIAILLVVLGAERLSAQTLDANTKFRLAQELERAGDLQRAAAMCTELYHSDPASPVIFDGLQRVLIQLKRYDDAIALIRNRLAASPADISLRGLLGSVMYKAGREQDADREWESIIAADTKNLNVYRLLANVLTENRLLDRAADVYRRARRVAGDESAFSMELAQLMVATMDYSGATTEFIRWLDRNPSQIGFVQNRMASFTANAEGRRTAIEEVLLAIHEKEDPRRYELLGWLYLEGGEFEKAFEVYRTLDRVAGRQGGALYDFAERAFKARAYAIAARAYQEAMDNPLAKAQMPYALFGYASALEQEGLQSDSIRGPFAAATPAGGEQAPLLDKAISGYHDIILQYPRTEFSAKSWYRIGVLESDRFFHLDGSLNALARVAQELAGSTALQQQVVLKIGEVEIVKGDTARAAADFRLVVATPSALPDQIDEANFRLAELDYFAGHFEAASARLAAITLNLKADYANDALALETFLAENMATPPEAIKDFARADFLARQRRNSEAISAFHRVAETAAATPIANDALMNVAGLQAKAGMFADAISTFEHILTQFKEHGTLLDRAEFRIGEVYQFGVREPGKALAAYERLLADFPRSVFADEARKRIRQLRGEAF